MSVQYSTDLGEKAVYVVRIVKLVLQKNYMMYGTWKDIQDSEYYNYTIRIISHISQNIKIKWKGITWQKSLQSAMHEYISDPAGRSFISCNRTKMDTAIVRTFALTKSISLTFRAVKFVLFSRCLCGSNGSSKQLQSEIFFTITLHYYLVHSTKKYSLTCKWGQILIIRQDLPIVY